MNVKSLLKSTPVAAMLCAAFVTASAAMPTNLETSLAVSENLLQAKPLPQSTVRPLDINEGETIFTYAPDGLSYVYGARAAGDYDVAIRLDGNSFAGAKVTGIRFYLLDDQYTTNVSGWTSTTLGDTPTGEEVDVTDIIVPSSENDWNEVRFSTPVEVPADGLYCGYSLTITRYVSTIQGTGYPLALGDESSINDNGFFFRFTGYDWESIPNVASLCMQVILTDVPQGASISLPDYVIVKPGEAPQVTLSVYDHSGSSSLSIEYTYSINGQSGTGTATNNNANTLLGAANDFDIELPAIAETGEYPLTVELTKVNGNDNANDNAQATTTIAVTDLDIKHRAVVEEYTGTWCGYCPKGYVAMEYMAEKYPEDFIGLAYHDDDPMEGRNVVMPSSVTGFPAAHLDRASGQIDPYLGAGSTEMGIEQDWLDRCNEPSPAAIEVEASLSDDLETVSVTSRTAFALEGTDGFKVAYALLADGMTGTGRSWQQRNYFGGSSTGLDLDLWDQFLNGGSYVTVEFNDVVILAPDSKGVTGSVPAEITVGEWNKHEYTFTLSDATSAYTASTVSLVQAPWKLRVVAMLLNADGEIVNAAKCNVSTPAGVNGVESSMDEPVEVARYSLDGRLLSEPERGVNLVKMSDGTVRKVIVK